MAQVIVSPTSAFVERDKWDMGFNNVGKAFSTVKQRVLLQVFLVLGIKATTAITRIRISRLGSILGGNVSRNYAGKRQPKTFYQ